MERTPLPRPGHYRVSPLKLAHTSRTRGYSDCLSNDSCFLITWPAFLLTAFDLNYLGIRGIGFTYPLRGKATHCGRRT